jgi:hypothetical protein
MAVSVTARTAAFRKKMKGARAAVQRFGRSVKQISGQLAKFSAVGLGAGTAALTAMVKKTTATVDETAKLARTLSMGTESLLAFRHAAEISGASAQTLDKALSIFVRRLGEVRMGSGEAKDGLELLGLGADRLVNMGTAEAFTEIAEAISKVKVPADAAAAAYKLFGRSGQQLLNTLRLGTGGLADMRAELESLGGTYSTETAAKFEEFADSITRFKAAVSGVAVRLSEALIPFLEVAGNKFAALAAAGVLSGKKIGQAVEKVIKFVARLADGLELIKAGFNVLKGTIRVFLLGFVAPLDALLTALDAIDRAIFGDEGGVFTSAQAAVRAFGEDMANRTTQDFQTAADAWDRALDGVNSKAAIEWMDDVKAAADEAAANIAEATRNQQDWTAAIVETGEAIDKNIGQKLWKLKDTLQAGAIELLKGAMSPLERLKSQLDETIGAAAFYVAQGLLSAAEFAKIRAAAMAEYASGLEGMMGKTANLGGRTAPAMGAEIDLNRMIIGAQHSRTQRVQRVEDPKANAILAQIRTNTAQPTLAVVGP